MPNSPLRDTPAAVAAARLTGALAPSERAARAAPHPHLGLWVTNGGNVRHALLPTSRRIHP